MSYLFTAFFCSVGATVVLAYIFKNKLEVYFNSSLRQQGIALATKNDIEELEKKISLLNTPASPTATLPVSASYAGESYTQKFYMQKEYEILIDIMQSMYQVAHGLEDYHDSQEKLNLHDDLTANTGSESISNGIEAVVTKGESLQKSIKATQRLANAYRPFYSEEIYPLIQKICTNSLAYVKDSLHFANEQLQKSKLTTTEAKPSHNTSYSSSYSYKDSLSPSSAYQNRATSLSSMNHNRYHQDVFHDLESLIYQIRCHLDGLQKRSTFESNMREDASSFVTLDEKNALPEHLSQDLQEDNDVDFSAQLEDAAGERTQAEK